ncbi:MAG: TraR/DksA C4-type zinc finger protein [Acidimicrobiales bacterium]|nr:TraR/DksA C4-type zinc finger protein [Acidimicrobiales bacterium]
MAPTTKAAANAAKAPAKTTAKRSTTTKATAKKAPAKAASKAGTGTKPAGKAPAKKAVPTKAAAPRSPKAAPAPTKVIASPALSRKATIKKAPPPRTGPLDKFLLGQLAALEEERVTYLRQAASLKAEADLLAAEREPGDVQFDEESGEGDTLAVERERDLTLSAQASAAVEEIDLAVARLENGTYGVCEQCNGIIPKERLRALPHASLCVQCKSAGFSRR